MMKKKYKLVPIFGSGLYKIKALRSFGDVKRGDIGGVVSGEHNLSHGGSCWIYDEARVIDAAQVDGNARVEGLALVFGHALVGDSAAVSGTARVGGNANVMESAIVCAAAVVRGDSNARGRAKIGGSAYLVDAARACGTVCVGGGVVIRGSAQLTQGAINAPDDFLVVGPIGTRDAYATFTLAKARTSARIRDRLRISTGCFDGSVRKLLDRCRYDKQRAQYSAAVDFAVAVFESRQL
jgi:hypothetical protein